MALGVGVAVAGDEEAGAPGGGRKAAKLPTDSATIHRHERATHTGNTPDRRRIRQRRQGAVSPNEGCARLTSIGRSGALRTGAVALSVPPSRRGIHLSRLPRKVWPFHDLVVLLVTAIVSHARGTSGQKESAGRAAPIAPSTA